MPAHISQLRQNPTSDNSGSSCIAADVDAYFGHNAAVEMLTVGGGGGGSYGGASGEVVDAAFPTVRKGKVVEAGRDAPGLEHKVLGIACQWMQGFIINSPVHAVPQPYSSDKGAAMDTFTLG